MGSLPKRMDTFVYIESRDLALYNLVVNEPTEFGIYLEKGWIREMRDLTVAKGCVSVTIFRANGGGLFCFHHRGLLNMRHCIAVVGFGRSYYGLIGKNLGI